MTGQSKGSNFPRAVLVNMTDEMADDLIQWAADNERSASGQVRWVLRNAMADRNNR